MSLTNTFHHLNKKDIRINHFDKFAKQVEKEKKKHTHIVEGFYKVHTIFSIQVPSSTLIFVERDSH